VAIGALIRELRLAHGWSQDDLADAVNALLPEATVNRSDISRYESEKRLPTTARVISALSRALNTPETVLRAETRLSRVERRTFLSLAALTLPLRSLADEIYASVAANDERPLATVQTSHSTDLAIAYLVEPGALPKLRRWMTDGGDAVLRVNAAGILAKLPGQGAAPQIASVLAHDDEVRRLYSTAVAARVCALDWPAAARFAENPAAAAHPERAARRLAAEALSPRDAGARWCSALMLRDLAPVLGGGR
jgi:transcriptional regulator with XRE-family HTH domain